MAKDKKVKVVRISEDRLVDLMDKIVEAEIKERNLVAAPVKEKKTVVVTESQLNKLLEKGVKIKSVKRKSK